MYPIEWNPGVKDFLEKIGADPEVIAIIDEVDDPKLQGKLANEVRKRPSITAGEIQEITAKMPKKREPTIFEIGVVRSLGEARIEGSGARNLAFSPFGEWALIQMMKHRPSEGSSEDGIFALNDNYYDHENAVDFFLRIRDWQADTHPAMHNYTLEEALRESDAWHEEQASQGSGKSYDREGPSGEVVYEFEDGKHNGWTIRTVVSENDLRLEGNLMGHCVGSYCGRVEAGTSRIFSLRDRQNQPHVTTELKGDREVVVQIQGKQDKKPIKEYRELVGEWLQDIGAVKILEQPDNSITYSVWERYELSDAVMAIYDYINDDADSFDEDPDYGIPMVTEIEFSDPKDVYDAIVEKWRSHYKDKRGHHNREIDELTENAEAWADGVAASLFRLIKVGDRNNPPKEGDKNYQKGELLIEAAVFYYGLYQVRDAISEISRAFPEYHGLRYGQTNQERLDQLANEFLLRFGKNLTADNYEREYVPFANEIVESFEPPYILAKAVLEKFGFGTFSYRTPDAPGQMMLFENPRRRR